MFNPDTLFTSLRLLLLRLGKALIRLSMDAELRHDLSTVYARLDGQIPTLLPTASPVEMTGSIASTIADVTGHKATSARIDAVVSLYNPVAATLRNLRQ